MTAWEMEIDAERHTVCFVPTGWTGRGSSVGLTIPECELHLCVLCANGDVIRHVNGPPKKKDVLEWLKYACLEAAEHQLPLILSCATAEWAASIAHFAMRRLSKHHRIAPERIYQRPEDRCSPEKLN
jgi:hypothetical protein